MRWFTTTDPIETLFMLDVSDRRNELAAEEREDQAIRTANAVAKVLGL